MKKCLSVILLLILLLTSFSFRDEVSLAEIQQDSRVYKIYNELGDFLAEKQDVIVGDSILTTDFIKYKIVQIDEDKGIAFAEFEERLKKPDVSFNYNPTPISQENPTLCLYMTHNDESYIVGDGYDSIYGAGGIHDIAKQLKNCFEDLGINTFIDETLHIPHDSYAYSRSSGTAKRLINTYSPDAIFDIHRDGASRKTYVKSVNGKERCQIRIVVGKSSSNFKIAEQFAMYLVSVASEICDWLFLDIYYASGHYNQGLTNKALLFEMGSHLVEKNLVEKSVPELAKVVKVALFNTTVDTESGDLTINGNINNDLPEISDEIEDENIILPPTINEVLDNADNTSSVGKLSTVMYFVVVVFGAGIIAGIVLKNFVKKPKKKKGRK